MTNRYGRVHSCLFLIVLCSLFLFSACSSDSSLYDEAYEEGYEVGYAEGKDAGEEKAQQEVEKELSSFYANDFQELAEYYTGATLYTEDDLWEILDDALHYGYLVGYGDRAQGNDCYYTERLFDYYPEYEDHFDHNMDDIKNALHN